MEEGYGKAKEPHATGGHGAKLNIVLSQGVCGTESCNGGWRFFVRIPLSRVQSLCQEPNKHAGESNFQSCIGIHSEKNLADLAPPLPLLQDWPK